MFRIGALNSPDPWISPSQAKKIGPFLDVVPDETEVLKVRCCCGNARFVSLNLKQSGPGQHARILWGQFCSLLKACGVY